MKDEVVFLKNRTIVIFFAFIFLFTVFLAIFLRTPIKSNNIATHSDCSVHLNSKFQLQCDTYNDPYVLYTTKIYACDSILQVYKTVEHNADTGFARKKIYSGNSFGDFVYVTQEIDYSYDRQGIRIVRTINDSIIKQQIDKAEIYIRNFNEKKVKVDQWNSEVKKRLKP